MSLADSYAALTILQQQLARFKEYTSAYPTEVESLKDANRIAEFTKLISLVNKDVKQELELYLAHLSMKAVD